MQEVRIRVEHIHVLQVGKGQVSVSKLHMGNTPAKNPGRSRGKLRWAEKVRNLLAGMGAAAVVYLAAAPAAYQTRGYFALGGEAALALVTGFLAYQIGEYLRKDRLRWQKEKNLENARIVAEILTRGRNVTAGR